MNIVGVVRVVARGIRDMVGDVGLVVDVREEGRGEGAGVGAGQKRGVVTWYH